MRLGIIGFGNIASTLLDLLQQSDNASLEHLAVLVRPDKVDDTRSQLASAVGGVADSVGVVTDAAGLLDSECNLVIECAAHQAVRDHVPALLKAGTDVVLVSIGSLADAQLDDTLRNAALAGGSRLILPSGAIGGIDLLSALRASGEVTVVYRGTKPPAAWRGTPAESVLDLSSLQSSTVFFSGDARGAATEYPKNANVAATLALAGGGFEATRVELLADPQAPGNIHEYTVSSKVANYSIRIENLPSANNAKTSIATVYSVLREISNRMGPVAI